MGDSYFSVRIRRFAVDQVCAKAGTEHARKFSIEDEYIHVGLLLGEIERSRRVHASFSEALTFPHILTTPDEGEDQGKCKVLPGRLRLKLVEESWPKEIVASLTILSQFLNTFSKSTNIVQCFEVSEQ